MNTNLKQAFIKQKKASQPLELSGTLGIAINGQRTVEVENRNGFVYVQLRNNQNELIQALNDKVSPVYGLPVIVVRQGNRYVIKGRDTERYTDWESFSSFLPRHGDQHSFNDAGGGGDIVWVYGRQFMPMLALPSGSLGGPNVVLADYVIQKNDGSFIYGGNTGTPDILGYKPTNNDGVIGLVFVDAQSGNPGVLVNTGTFPLNSITGTAGIIPYLPPLTSQTQYPVMGFRLSSGTSSIGWGNLYDIRQYYHGLLPTGTSGGLSSIAVQDEGIPQGNATTFNFVGSGVVASISGSVANINVSSGGSTNPGGSDTQVQFNLTGTFSGDSRFVWDYTSGYLRIGPAHPYNFNNFQLQMVGASPNSTPTMSLLAYGTGTSTAGSPHPTWIGYRQRGNSINSPEGILDNDGLSLLVGAGYDGANFINSARLRFSAQGNWITGTYTGSKAEIQITPSGTNTRSTRLEVVGNGTNIPDGTYMISGSPHQHANRYDKYPFDARLTFQTGIPYPTGTQTAKSILYLTPFNGKDLALFDGSEWFLYPLNGDVSISITGTTANLPYDIFVYPNNGNPTLELAAWTNGTTRATTIAQQDGVDIKSGTPTRRLAGTILITSVAGQGEVSPTFCGISNRYNQMPYTMFTCPGYVNDAAATSYNNNTTNYAEANGGTGSRLNYILCMPQAIQSMCFTRCVPASGGILGMAIGYDTIINPQAALFTEAGTGAKALTYTWGDGFLLNAGAHFQSLLFCTLVAGPTVIVADNGGNRQGASQDPMNTLLRSIILM